MPEIASDQYDLVVADFLIAAVSAFRPYRESECLDELCRVLKPGGRLVITGWDVWAQPKTQLDSDLRRLFSLRSAVGHLLGLESYREHPADWVEARLRERNLPPETLHTLADVHYDFNWFGRQIQALIHRLQPDSLRRELHDELDRRERPIRNHPAFQRGFEFGRLYAVVACRLDGGILLRPPSELPSVKSRE
jgi:SAM-dependent methyltransferase